MQAEKQDTISPPSGGEPGTGNAGDTLPPDVASAVETAEAIAQGQPEPATLQGAAGSKGGGSDSATPEPTPPPSVPLGGVIVCITDHLFCLAFGPGSGMQGELREQAAQAWDAVIERYLPMVQEAGPLGALALCYVAHAAPLVMERGWTKHEKPSSPGSPDAENPPS